ncbi:MULTISPECIES: UDP-N-acetylmuramoyl-L-alanine--D-glutamate ligase [unclassified Ectothiorhodospira]|uniref:UDP-N-acetylmuramoyl-L-alanine--D-glutamate ligase n=1 Tax=unclassified Ectothiorhodospira TaxID=2684909 RepID=UPI001EE982D6|nr:MULTISPECIES: UDP-N-acetylmuramoyl-L-alanine--D-glutamate ligase [unclassified Ectothiorhodospira]MCG5515080.1 UDP-N-acetylmuramoyl-L-alanine--D-glutamate ligase [Ectothiorhodospira sp. 9100]MCG5517798.1 UDP-N-acetylmuramoyl-L-alanine--D-glutamate ligase [Ectothiorhodospira sp. 9905]
MKTLIVGLGSTGLSVARYLTARGEPFCVADSRENPPGAEALRALAPEVSLYRGPFDPDLFAGFERLVVSPGVSVREPAVRAAVAAGARVEGDIELFAQAATAPVVAITGSNGKSTVTTLLGEMARATGRRVAVGGNLGPPALDLLSNPEPDLYVLELSSFQLETTDSLACAAAVVLNVSADHLDRYRDLSDYAEAKSRIYRRARAAVINRDDPVVSAMQPEVSPVSFGLDVPETGQFGLHVRSGVQWLSRGEQTLVAESTLRVAGSHNIANALAALALADAVGLPLETSIVVLGRFTGLPHRCQWLTTFRGVNWYNDSKGTNLGSTLAALTGLPGRVVLIAGGQGKGQDFTPLRQVAQERARAVVLLGQDAGVIEQALDGVVPVVRARDLDQAVDEAARLARRKDSVLLSPACASFDMFRGYEHRGEVFEAAVRRLVS